MACPLPEEDYRMLAFNHQGWLDRNKRMYNDGTVLYSCGQCYIPYRLESEVLDHVIEAHIKPLYEKAKQATERIKKEMFTRWLEVLG